MMRARGLILTVVLATTLGLMACSAAPALAAVPEAPETLQPSEPVHATEAVLHGVLNPKAPGEPGEYEFLYKKSSTECMGGSKAPSSPAISVGGEHEEVSETVTGLEAGATYTVCLLARNGTTVGENEALGTPPVTFTTATPAEAPDTEPVTGETSSTAILHGVLNPHGTVTTKAGWFFAYNTEATCAGAKEQQTAHEAELEGEALPVPPLGNPPVEIGGLEPNQKYEVCLVATNNAGEPTPGSEVPFETLPLAPTIAGESAFGVKSTEASLEAQINPNNENTKYTFEYSTKVSGEPLALEEPVVKEPGAAELEGYPEKLGSVALSGLAPSTTYYYRVVAENAQSNKEPKPAEGEVKSFTTVPTPTTEAVTAPTATTATFNGNLTPLNETVTTQYRFSYNLGNGGTCTGENSTPTEEAGTGPGTEVVKSVNVTGLQPNAEYTVCLVASNQFGSEQQGTPVHFKTLAVPLEIVGESISGVTPTEATLEAQVNPNNWKTTYVFEYATNPTLTGATVLPGAALEGFGPQTADAPTGAVLSVGETYYYRVVVTNTETSEVVNGTIQSFTPQGAPLVGAGEAQSITRTTATLPGTVNPAGSETFYYYQYGTSMSYGGNAPSIQGVSAGSGFSAVPAPIGISGLVPATTYHYRLLATNAKGTTYSPDKTFTTAPPTPPTASTGEASNITLTTATVTGTINPEGLETSYELDLGIDTTYGTSIYGEAGSASTPTEVTVSLQNLAPGSTYHYRMVAINSDGRTYGADRMFTTPVYSNPIVQPPVLPLLGTPVIAFPIDTTNTAKLKIKKHAKKSKHKKHIHKKKHKKEK